MSDWLGQDQTTGLPLPLARCVDEVCCRFEAAWKAAVASGEPPCLEAFLTLTDPSARAALLRELLQIEAHYRRRTGDEPCASDYRARFPDLEPAWLETVLAPREEKEEFGAGGTEYSTGFLLGNYRLLDPLGEGGMGLVFRAIHLLMNRQVAIKLIHPDLMNDRGAVQRFRLEIQAAAQLNHPNVVAAHDADEANGRHFLVMEYCEGVTLRRLTEQAGTLPTEVACEYIRQTALGLQHAFERGLIHRDIKPDNLMLVGATVKILDFGLARLRAGVDTQKGPATREGMILGTPDFLAPEQAEGRPDIRSDLYSLGCTFYFLLTGRPPFPGGTLIEKCLRHKTEVPEPLELQRPDVPLPVQQIVYRLMAKNPDDRFQTPAEVATALTPLTTDRSDANLRSSKPGGRNTPGSSSPEPKEPPPRAGLTFGVQGAMYRIRLAAGLGGALVVAIVCIIVVLRMWNGRDPGPHESPGTRPASPLRTWRKFKMLPIPVGQAATYGLAFSPDGRLLAGAFGNNEDRGPKRPGRLLLWEVGEWGVVLDREAESGPATCVAFSPDGRRLAWGTGSWNHDAPGYVTLWDLMDRTVKAHFEAHSRGVFGLAFQPGGDLLATSGREGKVRLWDGRWGAPRGELHDGGAPILALAFSPDGKRLVAGSDDGSVNRWAVSTRQSLGPLSRAPGKPVRGVAFSADGETVVAVTKKGQGATADLISWNWQGRKLGPGIALGETNAYCLAMSQDRSTFLAGFQNGTVKQYQMPSCMEIQTLNAERPVFCLAFSPDGKYLAVSGGWAGQVQLWREAED